MVVLIMLVVEAAEPEQLERMVITLALELVVLDYNTHNFLHGDLLQVGLLVAVAELTTIMVVVDRELQAEMVEELDGPIGMQWKEDADGVPHLIEINPRLQGTTSALALAGVNLPVQAVRLALGLELTASTADIVWGKQFVRFWDERLLD